MELNDVHSVGFCFDSLQFYGSPFVREQEKLVKKMIFFVFLSNEKSSLRSSVLVSLKSTDRFRGHFFRRKNPHSDQSLRFSSSEFNRLRQSDWPRKSQRRFNHRFCHGAFSVEKISFSMIRLSKKSFRFCCCSRTDAGNVKGNGFQVVLTSFRSGSFRIEVFFQFSSENVSF